MDCARVMRGMNSIAKADTPFDASAFNPSREPIGSIMPAKIAPGLIACSSSCEGRPTFRMTSAWETASAAFWTISAPASLKSWSGMNDRSPAPA